MSVTTTPNGYTLNTGGQRVVVDPVTRIEGHMRCEVNIDANNVITNAVSTGTMWRGLEVILRGRDPRDAWAFVERICGVCTGCHALASCRAVEDALGIEIPYNAFLIREMMAKTLQVHDHVVHFYHLHALDWVNPVNALKADPKGTSKLQQLTGPKHPNSSPGYFRDIQTRIRKFIESGQLGPFKNGYWDNPAYKLSPEADLMAVTHYLEALDLQKEFVKLHTVFGGKNPHPNYLVGGVPCAINMDGVMAAGAPLNMERLFFVKARIDEMKAFNDNVYVPDVLAIASFYKKQLWGGGLGAKSVMDYGAYPLVNHDKSTDQLPGGVILDDNWDNVMEIDPRDPEQVQEFVNHSWYKYPDESKGLHPWDGITEPNYDVSSAKGTRTNIEEIDENAKYSWIKAPRWRGHAVEVGPLSRYTLGYAQGVEYIQEQIHKSVAAFNALAGTDLGAKPILQSTIGRTLARALES
ncbi:MAG: nickel-dependent hydrogenase large subunit, partial [Ghiorsea sp.]|nr:nickel-dependent hydrogenase large subunit [Ghiorsea sp.]